MQIQGFHSMNWRINIWKILKKLRIHLDSILDSRTWFRQRQADWLLLIRQDTVMDRLLCRLVMMKARLGRRRKIFRHRLQLVRKHLPYIHWIWVMEKKELCWFQHVRTGIYKEADGILPTLMMTEKLGQNIRITGLLLTEQRKNIQS